MTLHKQPNQRERIAINNKAAAKAVGVVRDSRSLTLHLGDTAIAKRGLPGSKDAGRWVPLEPGYLVRDDLATGEIIVEFNGVRVH